MKLSRIARGAALALALSTNSAPAQTYRDTNGNIVPGVVVVDPTDNSGPLFSVANPGHVNSSVGGFTPSAAGARMTPLPVATSDSSGTLPTGAVVVVSNVGSTNPMDCNVNGVAATTSDQLIGANSWFAFTIPNGVTTLHCIATGGATTANAVGGAGLPTGAGGGGGGGGGAITAPLGHATADVAAVSVVPSATATFPVTGTFWQATQPVSAASLPLPDGAAADSSLTTLHNDLTTLNTTAGSMIPAGTAIIGKAGIDQTTPGTTNGVSLAQVGANTVSTGAGATGTGTQRVGVAQDTTTIAGSAPGTAGSASAQVVTVQGIASGTNVNTAIVSCSTCNNNGAAVIGSSTPVGLPSDQFGLSTDTASTVTNSSAATAIAIFKEISALEQAPVSRAVTNAGTFAVQVAATTSGGASVYHKIATASDNHVVIKNGAGTFYGIDATTGGTAIQYVRLYDAGTGFNACNSATGLIWGQQVPAAAVASGAGSGFAIPIPAVGIAFSTGLSICITGAVSDTDTTNAATTTVVNVPYK